MTVPRTVVLAAGVLAVAAGMLRADTMPDPRDIRTGREIPSEGYADQPYVVVLADGAWLCVLTTGRGREGEKGQHVVSTRSTDHGRTWSPLADIEPADGPEASWAVPLATPDGRVYVFYTYNGDRVGELGGKPVRADMLGWYAYRYSDDGGRTWSRERRRLPMRATACDRANDWQGKVQLFWGVSKPIVSGDAVYLGFTKLGRYMLDQGEGWLYRSDNVLREPDAAKVRWELLPEGDHGIRAPQFGSVQEEHVVAALGGGGLLCVYRTTTGYPCQSVSVDGGRTWSAPCHMAHTPGGRPIRNPRANVKVWRTAAGKYLLWYHNHGGRDFRDRNPAWLSGGIERDGRIFWSQPEVVLYDVDPKTRMSYPDLIEDGGEFFLTETQKTVARVHEVAPAMLDGLWGQSENRRVATDGLVADLPAERCAAGATAPMPRLPDLSRGGGFAVGLWVRFDALGAGQTLLDARAEGGRGVALTTTADAGLRIELGDGKTAAQWDTDPGVLTAGRWHHVAAIVDGGPKLITFVVDGVLCDGGEARQFGWGRFSPALGEVTGRPDVTLAPTLRGRLGGLRLYDRYLRTSEAVANFRAGRARGAVGRDDRKEDVR